MALDKANDRLFIGHHGNSRYDIYQLDEAGLPLRRHADRGIGRSLIGRGFAFAPLGREELNFPTGGSFDSVNQRLFVPDGSGLGPPGARIMVFDLDPEYLDTLEPTDLPEAIAVLGQPNFDTWDPGIGPDRIGSRGTALVAEDRQLLFFTDGANNRVLVWDIDPEQLETGMEAIAVIGQPDFVSREDRVGRDGLSSPNSLAYDPRREALFVMDGNRVLAFDVSEQSLDQVTGFEAFAVIGQDDFDSNEPNEDSRKISNGPISLDYEYDRLLVGSFTRNRVMMFDVSPAALEGASNPDAIAVLGQPDFEDTDPAITQDRLTMTRVTVDTDRQIAYVPDGYPAGNRINIFDIHPERMSTTMTPLVDQLGHINPEGEPDFLARSANDRISPRFWTQGRDVSVDRVHHRLFMSDNYSHRVMIFQLDRMNRLLDRGARWVLGQQDPSTSVLLPGRDASTIKLPLAVEYDESHERVFVADTWNERVLVFDMTPGQVASGMAASYVLGQADFTSYEQATAADRLHFGSREGNGIGTSGGRTAELALDKVSQRLFVADGSNNRVLVFDVHPDRIANGAPAIGVLGQDDFVSKEEGLSASRWRQPGDLVVDEAGQRLFVELPWQERVLVFDVHPDRFEDGMAASYVIGQPDFTSAEPGLSRQRFRQPDGISHDAANNHLYVSHKFHHRVLVFDVSAETMQNFPAAIGVIGEHDFETMSAGPGDPRNHQDRLHDPRGSFFDEHDQRLFQTEGLNGRMTVFTMPRETWRVNLPPRSNLRYASLDALMSTGPEPYESGYSELQLSGAGRVAALSTHFVTRAVIHPQSERQSRELISAAVLAADAPESSASIYVDTSDGRDTAMSLVNGNDAPVSVEFELQTLSGEQFSETRRLDAGAQLSDSVADLFEGTADLQGVLRIEADAPLGVNGLLEIPNGAGDTLLAPAPMTTGEFAPGGLLAERRILPAVTTGAGQHVQYVLLNPGEEPVSGQLEVSGHAPVEYEIDPRGVFVHEMPPDGEPPLAGYGIVRASRGVAPSAHAIVTSLRRGGGAQSVHTVASHQEGTLFWAPVDTWPDVLHHGDIDAELSIVNEGLVPATLYLELFDIDGASAARHERTVPLGERVVLSLEEVFGMSPLRGTVRVFADADVAVAMQESTVAVDGDVVVTDVPLQATPESAIERILYPVFRNGDGQATELVLINTDRDGHEGGLSVVSARGEVQTTILR